MSRSPIGKSKKPAILTAAVKPQVVTSQVKAQAEALQSTAMERVEQSVGHAEALTGMSSGAVRDLADRALGHAKDNYNKFKSATEEASSRFEQSYANTSKGFIDCTLKLVEMARASSNAAFDYATQVAATRSFAEVVEISGTHARRQFDLLQEQGREFTAMTQKLVAEAAEPARETFRRSMREVA